jgi:hypothetical protein
VVLWLFKLEGISVQVERKNGPKDKTIYCNVPPMLPGTMLADINDIQANPAIEAHFGDFSIAEFMARYLAGNRSLKQARTVSRKRLALVSCGIGYLDPEALALNCQIDRYLNAKQKFLATDSHTLDSILALNLSLAPEEKKSGMLREIQSWVGGKTIFKARYVCPPPELVPELINNWLEFINSTDYAPPIKAIMGHCRLLTIHPFLEGNGRLSRVLLDGILEKAYGPRVPLFSYRLSPLCTQNNYIEALELLNVGDHNGIAHPFWTNALAWGTKLQLDLTIILSAVNKRIISKIAMRNLSGAARQLIDHLWAQPIVCEQGLLSLMDNNLLTVRTAIKELVELGLLEMRRLREPQNTTIYDCPLIFSAYTAIDDLIFSTN